ncbi:MAG: hypothetical protein ABI855_06205 [Bacteroidota bacterium]
MRELNYIDYSQILFIGNLETLVNNYNSFETKVENDLILSCFSFLKLVSSRNKGNEVCINSVNYKISFNLDSSTRTFVISVLETDVSKNISPMQKSNEFLEIGFIKKIEINYSRGISKLITLLLEYLSEQLRFAYLAFETAFLSKFKNHEAQIISSVYNRVVLELLKENKKGLENYFWFTVTNLSTKVNNDTFSFYFDTNSVKHTINHLKNNQSRLFSPFEIVYSLLLEKVPDDGIEYYKEDKIEVMLEFKKMPKANSEFNKYWNGLKVLFSGHAFGFTYISNHNGHLLALNYTERHSKDIIRVITPIYDELNYIFKENLNKAKFETTLFAKRKINMFMVYKEGRSIIESIIAKYLHEKTS